MTKAEWKAVYDYCEANMISKYELSKVLKKNGAIAKEDTLEDLGRYIRDHTYDDMMRFLEENV